MRTSAARDRLLATASRVFYHRGIHAVAVDEVITAAEVSRATFYRYFPGKEDLVRAYLVAHDLDVRAHVAEAVDRAADPRAALVAVVTGLGEDLCDGRFRGCPFINAAAEYPDPEHPVRKVVTAHRAWLLDTITALLAESGSTDPTAEARTLVMLRDGALVGGYLDDPVSALTTLSRAVGAYT
ncbi:TetR/AcrR family transcriptional regulator [Actinosynnema sp. NPDC020468]|uniref:TetR/AcrR family transcriptional regulator n=1 Tax=Actinosynnema sp. NPDC020468 TaxID=3154488 RepID=UPI0033FA4570